MKEKRWYIIYQSIRTNESYSVVELTEEQAQAIKYASTHMENIAGGNFTGMIDIILEPYNEKWMAVQQIIDSL